MKRFVVPFALFVLTSSFAHAATVGWGAVSSSLGLANGTLAQQGSMVRLGYFTINDAQIKTLAAGGDRTGLDSAFRQFDLTTVGNSFGIDGVWDRSGSNADPQFGGKSIYYWTLDAATLSAATQWGIYKGPTSTWSFPVDSNVAPPGVLNIDLSQIPRDSTGLIVGGYGLASVTVPTGGTDLYKMAAISAVPEPSTATFGLLAALGALCTRPRRTRSVQVVAAR